MVLILPTNLFRRSGSVKYTDFVTAMAVLFGRIRSSRKRLFCRCPELLRRRPHYASEESGISPLILFGVKALGCVPDGQATSLFRRLFCSMSAARTACQAGLDIRTRLAAADPANTGWQRDLQIIQQRINDLPDATD